MVGEPRRCGGIKYTEGGPDIVSARSSANTVCEVVKYLEDGCIYLNKTSNSNPFLCVADFQKRTQAVSQQLAIIWQALSKPIGKQIPSHYTSNQAVSQAVIQAISQTVGQAVRQAVIQAISQTVS